MLVDIRQLGRRFGPRRALEGVDLCVRAGRLVVLVGPNGSGKTTLLKIMAGMLRPSSGKVRLFGLDPRAHRVEIMRQARFAFAPPPLYESLSGWEHLRHIGAAGLPRRRRPGDGQLTRALETVGLLERAHDRVRAYSFGMRQRLVLALSLVPRPRLLVLDEPTDGLDPLAVLELRDVLRRLRDEHGIAIVLASHLLVEIEHLADDLLVLHEGRTVFAGLPEALTGAGRLVLTVQGDADRAAAVLREAGLHVPVQADGRLETVPGSIDLETAARLLRQHGITLRSFHERRPDLSSALLARLGRDGASDCIDSKRSS